MKLVIGNKDGKSKQIEIDTTVLNGLKIGDKVNGDDLNMKGYEFEITGGSDSSGFPMRKSLPGTLRRKILAQGGVGVKTKRKGMFVRKSVAGNTIYEKTAQVNLKILKKGAEDIFAEPKVEEKTEEEAKE